jgi:hypothetical protein
MKPSHRVLYAVRMLVDLAGRERDQLCPSHVLAVGLPAVIKDLKAHLAETATPVDTGADVIYLGRESAWAWARQHAEVCRLARADHGAKA